MIGDRIREILKRKGVEQKDLAAAIGMSEGNMSRIITGKVEPGHGKIEKMAQVLGVPVSAFYDEEVASKVLARDILEGLPDDIVKALSDVRNQPWLLLGLSMKDKELSREEIAIILESYSKAREQIKRGISTGG